MPAVPDAGSDERRLTDWVERTVGGHVIRVERLGRWRPAWDVDVERDGTICTLHARGDRDPNFAVPCRIADEVPIHDLLEQAGLPVPHAYGLCPDPYALVMDRLPGFVDLSFASNDHERRALIDEYLELQARIYAIDLDVAAAAGFHCPDDGRGIAVNALTQFEQVHDALMPAPDPLGVFLRTWLHRSAPEHRTQARFITYDAFQFMFQNGRITGLLDFELAHVGDPMMDLAALRVRDTIKNLGDLAEIAQLYSEATGEAVDHDVVDYHTVLYNALTVLSAAPPLAAPMRSTDLMSHMAWYVNSARWALEVMADMLGLELEPIEELSTTSSGHGAAYAHLAAGLRARTAETSADYELSSLQRVARHLVRIDEVGAASREADLDELADALGYRPDPGDVNAALVDLVQRSDSAADPLLVRLFDRRMQRAHALMGPPGSLMLRHPRLRSLRPGDETDAGSTWPPGLIPGTR